MKPFVLLFAISLSLWGADYTAREEENAVQLKTPYGEKTVIGDYGLSNYRFEIPLDDLLPEKLREMKMRGENIDQLKENLAKETKEKETHTIETKIIEKMSEKEGSENGSTPSRVTVEYDDTDRLVLEANRLYNKRKYDETLAVIDELLRRRPDFVRGWIMKGSVMYVRGHKDLALSSWKKAQLLQPNSEDIKSILEKYK